MFYFFTYEQFNLWTWPVIYNVILEGALKKVGCALILTVVSMNIIIFTVEVFGCREVLGEIIWCLYMVFMVREIVSLQTQFVYDIINK